MKTLLAIMALLLTSCGMNYHITHSTNYSRTYNTDSTYISVTYDSTVYKIKR